MRLDETTEQESNTYSDENILTFETTTQNDVEEDSAESHAGSPVDSDNHYYYSNKENTVSGRYVLQLDTPLHDFFGQLCEAFSVKDLKSQDPNQKLYGLVFFRGAPIRHKALQRLLGEEVLYHVVPMAIEIVRCTHVKEERLVVIFMRPRGTKLSQFLLQHGPCDELFIEQHVIPSMSYILKFYSESQLVHGGINPDNIYIDDELNLTLGDCFSEMIGYSQPLSYEPIERAILHAAGKPDEDRSADYFALGTLCTYLFIGYQPGRELEDNQQIQQRIIKGSYNILVGEITLPPRISDLIKGLLNDKKVERWKHRQLADWLKGRRYNLLPPVPVVDASRYIEFNDKKYFNLRALVHDVQQQWDLAKRFFADEKVIKWVERSVGSVELAEKLREIKKMNNHARSYVDDDEFVSRNLMVLDPDHVIRFKQLTISVEAIPNLLAYAYIKGKRDYLQLIAKIITLRLPTALAEFRGDIKHLANNSAILILDRINPLLTETTPGFGLERCLYDLCPGTPNLSSGAAGQYLTKLSGLMLVLEKNINQRQGNEIIDRHSAAFIAQKLDIQTPVRVKLSSGYSHIENHKDMISLALLAMAQRAAKTKKLKNLSNVMLERLKQVVTGYRSKTLRKEIITRLEELATGGDLTSMYRVMADPVYAKRDYFGFINAAEHYADLDTKIMQFRNSKIISERGYRYGLQLSVVIAYVIFAAVLLFVLIRVI
jgi:hypothetical protein